MYHKTRQREKMNEAETGAELIDPKLKACGLGVVESSKINFNKQYIVALRAETQKLEAIYQQKLLNLDELKKSILAKVFAGELKTEKIEMIKT
jgi:Holliday junction resolvasome RuvABC endonuclease subunit